MHAAVLEDEVGGGAGALDGSLVDGGRESGRAAQLDDELVELRRLALLAEQQQFVGEGGDGYAVQVGEAVVVGNQHAERIKPDQLGGHPGRGLGGASDADVQAPVGQLPVLLGGARLDLVDREVGMAALELAQDLRHGVVAGVDDARAKRRR